MIEESSSRNSNGRAVRNWFPVLISLIAFAISAYTVYENYKERIDKAVASASIRKLEDGMRINGEKLKELNKLFADSRRSNQTAISSQLDEFVSLIETDLVAIRKRLSISSEDWRLAEVEYLVRMANQRILMGNDVPSALQLLRSADGIVKNTKGLLAHDLRQALANDIARLEAVTGTDVQGIYLQLSALISQVTHLRRDPPSLEAIMPPTEEVAGSSTMLNGSANLLSQAAARLGGLIDFRRHDRELRPIPPPDEIYYLKQNVVFKLQIAQIALLQGDGEVYRRSLVEARNWVLNFFDADANRDAITSSIKELIVLEVSADSPDISASLEEARKIMADFNKDS